ncbi:MAG: hypothetical protein KGY99_10000 [Phycisphaerae bacterium]|nr:hypothetical protein [Phycisphaerae bacterium]
MSAPGLNVPAREALDALADALSGRPYVLSLSHSDSFHKLGGTEKVIVEQQRLLADRGVGHVQASVFATGRQPMPARPGDQLLVVNVDAQRAGVFSAGLLAAVLRRLARDAGAGCRAVHLHHMLHWAPGAVETLLDAAAAPVRFFVHDYHTICPQFRLLRNDRTYCGGPEPDSELCRTCKYGPARQAHWPTMRRLFGRGNIEPVAPSQAAAEVWLGSYPEYRGRVRVVPHLLRQRLAADDADRARRLRDPGYRPRLAFVGYEHPAKGWDAWQRVMLDRRIAAAYDLHILGHCRFCPPHVQLAEVSFVDQGLDAMVRALQDRRIDLAVLWSIWPETYSYTLQEALAANCYVLTTAASGNIADQVRREGRGCVLPDAAALVRLLRQGKALRNAAADGLAAAGPETLTSNPATADRVAVAGDPPAPPDAAGLEAALNEQAESSRRRRQRLGYLAGEGDDAAAPLHRTANLPGLVRRGVGLARRLVPRPARRAAAALARRYVALSVAWARSLYAARRLAKTLAARR